MIILRKIAILLMCMIFITTPLFCCSSYAASSVSDWYQVTTNDQLSDAFRYYCKSRDLTIEGSLADAVTSFTTQTFNSMCNAIGIDMTALQAHLKYRTDNLGHIEYLFDSTGITAYNQIFAQFLQDNEIDVGDSVDDVVYSGSYFRDDNGKSCLMFIINRNGGAYFRDSKSLIAGYGNYLYSDSFLVSDIPLSGFKNYSFVVDGVTYAGNKTANNDSNGLGLTRFIQSGSTWNGLEVITPYDRYYNIYVQSTSITGGITAVKFNDGVYLGSIGLNSGEYFVDENRFLFVGVKIQSPSENNVTNNININITTGNNVINNNYYEGDTIINDDGTPSTPNAPEPGPDYNPYPGGGGTTTSPSSGNGGGGTDGTINFPDLDINLPEINWSLGDLSNKFPFSIPFDLVSLVTVLDAPAEAPKFEGTVDFGFTTWDYDIDLAPFDNVAAACRIAETLLFVFGLIIITRNLIRG